MANQDRLGEWQELTERERIARYKRVDLPLLLLVLAMTAFGLVMLFSASMSMGYADQGIKDSLYYFNNQLRYDLLGLVAMLLIIYLRPIADYNRPVLMFIAYGVTTLLLVLVAVRGQNAYGAVRWVSIAGVRFQPSEIAKIASVYCLASYYSLIKRRRAAGTLPWKWPRWAFLKDAAYDLFVPMVAMGVWILLILVQPHLSGAAILFFLVLSVFLIVKIPRSSWANGLLMLLPLLIIGLLLLALVFPLIKGGSLMSYVSEKFAHVFLRISTFNKPDEASSDAIRQTLQARYALGAGGLTGLGLGQGRQKMAFLSMIHNDYILPSVGEELGFLGTMCVVLMFAVFSVLGLRVALKANSLFATCMAFGYSFLITLQAWLNIAVAVELMPATGISLPFFSSGGTANVFFLMACGFILCVSRSGLRVDAKTEALMRPAASSSRQARKHKLPRSQKGQRHRRSPQNGSAVQRPRRR